MSELTEANGSVSLNGSYEEVEEYFRTEQRGVSRKRINTASSDIIKSWASLSYGISYTSKKGFIESIPSLINMPSNDRRSSGVMMGVNLQSMILGTSLLSLPYCYNVAGIWSLFLIFLIGILSTFTANILSDCQYQKSKTTPDFYKRIHTSFVDMSRSCWNKSGAVIMEILVYISLARNVVVIILLTDLTQEILSSFEISGYDTKLLSVGWTLLTLPLLFITRVSILAFTSFIGLILYLVAMATVMVLCVLHFKEWNLSGFIFDFDIHGFGIACGIIINSYAVHMNLPALEGSLKKPEVYKKVNNITFASNIVCKIAFTLVGYLTYLENTKQEITTNIENNMPLPMLLRLAVIFFAYFTIPLQSFVVFTLIDDTFKPKFPVCQNDAIWLIISRGLFMTFCLLVAVVVPQFGLVVAFIGSVRGSAITFILPAMYYISLKTIKKCRYKLICCYFIVLFGTFASVVGAYSSLYAIIYW